MKFRSDIFIGLTAVFVSICALFVSIRQSQLMEVQQEAMLYPHLTLGRGYSSEGFHITLKNSGTGLAMIKSVEVNCGETYFPGWKAVFDHYLPEGHQVGWNMVGASSIQESVLIPGEEVNIFNTRWNPETRILVDSLENLNFKIQYASLLESHWEISTDQRTPKKIKFKPRQAAVQFD